MREPLRNSGSSKMTTEQIEFTEEQAAFIRDVVASGQYRDVHEVIRTSLQLLEERLMQERENKNELRKMLEEAQASGVSDRTARDAWEDAIARHLLHRCRFCGCRTAHPRTGSRSLD